MVGSVEVWGIKTYGRGPSPGVNSFPEFPSQSSTSWGEIIINLRTFWGLSLAGQELGIKWHKGKKSWGKQVVGRKGEDKYDR